MYILMCFVQVVSVFYSGDVAVLMFCPVAHNIGIAVLNCRQGYLQLHIAQDVLKQPVALVSCTCKM